MPPSAGVVGREPELAVLESFLAAEPCPRALVVEGEPGAGKTTLLRASIGRAPDAQVLACWPAPGESALTVTEQRVAALVAGGRTNREVAAELVVSVRAVEANLTRVYAKLGVRSRAALAARFRG